MAGTVLLVITIFVDAIIIVLGVRGADAPRPVRESAGGSYPACWRTYEEARASVASWMARMHHGPQDGSLIKCRPSHRGGQGTTSAWGLQAHYLLTSTS
ncbi:unnamed protein product, partial [Musa hybrid cultivar]